jgi:outer membrane lipoprotein LolB
VSRFAWAAVAALVLQGCAAPPRAPDGGSAPDPQALGQWVASGRIAIASGADGGSGSFDWVQDGETSRLDLRGPLGAAALRLTMAPGVLSLTDGAGRTLDEVAAEADLRARLGADLPWDHLRFWMLGVPDPGQPAVVEDHGAAPWRTMQQGGWRLAYDSYAVVEGLRLPRRFAAEREGVRVRVIVDAWSPGATSRKPSGGVP